MKFYRAIFKYTLGTLLMLVVLTPCLVKAQNFSLSNADIGILVSTNGVGFTSRLPILKEQKELQPIIKLSFKTLKHPKEAKVLNLNYTNQRAYVFGKINQGATLRLGYGLKKKLSKNDKDYPIVSMQLTGGGILGILKPYYVRFDNPSDNNRILTIQQNKTTLKNQDKIVSPARWSRGLSEITTTIGIHTEMSINIGWNRSYSHRSINLGVSTDYFFKEFNILIDQNNKLFINLFATYSLGQNRA